MKRRDVLGVTGVVFGAGFAGCSSKGLGPDGPAGTGERTQSPAGSDDRREDSIYIENFDGRSYRLTLTVVAESTDETVLENRYDVPSEQGLEIPDIGREGQTYTVTAVVEDGPVEAYEWEVRDCEFDDGQDTALGVRLEDAEVTFLTNDCDAVSVGYELAYSDHTLYVVEEE